MARRQIRDYTEIFRRLISRTVARSGLTDLVESSAVRHILGAVAREIDEVYYQLAQTSLAWSIDTASGQDLDERARDIQPGTLYRLGGDFAQGQLVFSRATNTGTTEVVPRGTVVQTATGVQVRTDDEAVITNTSVEQITSHGVGRDSNAVGATALVTGTAGNIAVNTATVFVSQPAGIAEVTNVSAFTGGADRESDDEFRTRIRTYVSSLARCSVQAIEALVISVADPTTGSTKRVRFARVITDPIDRGNATLYIDDGAGTARTAQEITAAAPENLCAGLAGTYPDVAAGGEEFLYTNYRPLDRSAAAGTPLTLISYTGNPAGVNSVLRGTLVEGTDYHVHPALGQIYFTPALQADEFITASYTFFDGLVQEVQKIVTGDATDRVNYPGAEAAGCRVLVAVPTIVNIEVQGLVFLDGAADRATVLAEVQSVVLNYINRAGIGADIIRNEIIERVMGVPNVIDVSLSTPVSNIVVRDEELPRSAPADVIFT